jgi:uncharacterized protein (TIGR00255 family)
MTGYGKGENISRVRRVSAEVKSVNNRFLDLQFRGAHLPAETESLLAACVKQAVERGTLTLTVNIVEIGGSPLMPVLNIPLLRTYKKLFDQACGELKAREQAGAAFLLGLPDTIRLVSRSSADKTLAKQVLAAAGKALAALNQMRAKEGESLARDLEKRLGRIRDLTAVIANGAPNRTDAYKARLEKKMLDLLQSAPDDSLRTRLLTEVTLLADKTDTSEETTRLNSHLEQFLAALKNGGAVGKKLNFLQQEIYREANTISSKAAQPDVIGMCIAIKEESEKIREQIQNLE